MKTYQNLVYLIKLPINNKLERIFKKKIIFEFKIKSNKWLNHL
jgi:hypothetical protein